MTHIITLRVGNVHEPSLYPLGGASGRSPFQDRIVYEIAEHAATDFFCINPAIPADVPPYRGPVTLTFCTRDGVLHALVVGRRRLLRHCTADGRRPARCETFARAAVTAKERRAARRWVDVVGGA